MATKESERVARIRKRDYDRISFVMEKESRYLIRAQALREDVTSAEVMRRAILARCGLDAMPDTSTPLYQAIKDAEIRPEAEEAVVKLQEADRDVGYDLETYLVTITDREELEAYIIGLLDLLNELEDATDHRPFKNHFRQPADKLVLKKSSMMAVRRLLSNMRKVEPDDSEEPF